ncbi:unnamed protein product [Cylicocyclus nassatus]|uniref:Uncharacterized protein n=1 Tax=Cylicocyclus nassatus TaxID=53992 RepID=A0AA36GTH0_CYLNA|nr:unnamed protein product [Cylicocyclus nassatus]
MLLYLIIFTSAWTLPLKRHYEHPHNIYNDTCHPEDLSLSCLHKSSNRSGHKMRIYCLRGASCQMGRSASR